ncbi:MAG: Ig-like domain-containing protein [Chloroflexi bacterium]|nr:Ig-like domain-containing protein [Chloroflexota bacterium]
MNKRFSFLTFFGVAAVLLLLMGAITALAAPAAAVNGTITLDKAHYTNIVGATGAIVTVTDKDYDLASEDKFFTTTVEALAKTSGQFVQLKQGGVDVINAVGSPVVSAVGGTRATTAFGSTKANFTYSNAALGRGTLSTDGSAGVNTGDVVQIIFNTGQVDTVPVKLTSGSDPTGIVVNATETDVSTGVFKATITLTTTDSSAALKRLSAQDGSEIIAAFTDTPAVGAALQRLAKAAVEIAPPVFSGLTPANKTFTKVQRPTFTASISDFGSGIKVSTVKLIVGATTYFPTLTGSPLDGAQTVSFTFQVPADLAGLDVESPQDWQVEATDVAGNTGKSDSEAGTTCPPTCDKQKLTIDTKPPTMDSAETGVFWDTSKQTPVEGTGKATALVVRFNEELDGASVSAADFTVGGVVPADATVFSGSPQNKSVFITLAAALAGNSKPEVKIATGGEVKDKAGNILTSSAPPKTAADKIKPTLTVAVSKTLLKKNEESIISISSDEAISGAPKVEIINVTSGATYLGAPSDAAQLSATTWQFVFKSAGAPFEGKHTVKVTGSDPTGNAGSKGTHVLADAPYIIEVDTSDPVIKKVKVDNVALCDTTAGAAPAVDCEAATPPTKDVASTNPFVTVTYGEKVTITQALFGTGTTLADVTASGQLSAVLADGSQAFTFAAAASELTIGTTYTLRISAKDQVALTKNDKEFKFKVIAKAKVKFPLAVGQNLISLRSDPEDTAINAVITNSAVQSVLTYDPLNPDPVTGPWKSATRGADGKFSGGSLTTIDSKHAYWVSSTSFVDLEVVIPAPGFQATPPTIALAAGWNLVPVVSVTGLAVGTAIWADNYFASAADWVAAFGFEPPATWEQKVPKSFAKLTVGRGYWLYVPKATILIPVAVAV